MPNAKDFKRQKNASFLFIGDTGAGKTTLIGQFPKPFIYDFDRGISVLAGKDVDYEVFRDAPHKSKVVDPTQGIYKYGQAYPAFIAHLEKVGTAIVDGTWDHKTVAFDSLTLLQEICMNWILTQSNRSGEPPQIQDWGLLTDQFKKLFGQITSWPGLKIAVAHMQRDNNDMSKAVEQLPLLPPKLAAHLPVIFDEVYYFGVDFTAQGAKTFYMNTSKSPTKTAARSRWNVTDRCPPSFAKIIEYAGFKVEDFV